MGQSHDKLTQQQSKEELLYNFVNYGNAAAVASLCRDGANLECVDQKGRTPLILACLCSELIDVAKTLIEFHANVNAYRAGRHGGTPLHHAAKRGLAQTVRLLLSSKANALVANDECQTPLDVARSRGHTSVVRTIENHICCFSGWMREFHGPGFLEALAPQLLSRKIWVVVTPRGVNNSLKPLNFELSIYLNLTDAQPRTVISLWKAQIEEPKFNRSDPVLTIFDSSTKMRCKLASGKEGDKLSLQWLYHACRGIPQARTQFPMLTESASTGQSSEQINANDWADCSERVETHNRWGTTATPPPAPSSNGWADCPMRVETHNGWGIAATTLPAPPLAMSTAGWIKEPPKEDFNGWGPTNFVSPSNSVGTSPEAGVSGWIQEAPPTHDASTSSSITPSAPPIPEELSDDGRVHYPRIELEPFQFSRQDEDGLSSSCVICWEAPVQGACVPCGHMAGCIACLTEIQAKNGACPVCRTHIDRVLRLFAV